MPLLKNYEQIKNDIESDEKPVVQLDLEVKPKPNLLVLSLGIIFWFGFFAFLFYPSNVEKSAAPDIRDCSYNECHSAGCDVPTAPYLCVDQSTAYYGCSAIPWIQDMCGDSCSLENCDETSPSDDQKSCRGISCGEDRCGTDYQKCGDDAPYQCTDGSAAMGCSDNEYDWLIVSDTLCSSCCDTTMC
mmetsp:Transcript_13520/g.16102  ORF Transcript_13520/g.16102 Transcript_13520/m.16102 type:complete len:187 (+) Transcript_13520:80-640(+)